MAGGVAGGAVVSPDFAERVAQAFRNAGVALAAHGLDLGHVVQLRTYVVDHDVAELAPIGAAIGKGRGAKPPVNPLVGVASPATPDMLFEVEALAARP
ncbi:Rid family hydrolase [Streptomyces sp. NPDC093089]|uniref:Rid family hydrolase n=1 Tax=Streptomyces sp. NPDC093089 TaxID=3366024 RepID=UPI0037F40CAF